MKICRIKFTYIRKTCGRKAIFLFLTRRDGVYLIISIILENNARHLFLFRFKGVIPELSGTMV